MPDGQWFIADLLYQSGFFTPQSNCRVLRVLPDLKGLQPLPSANLQKELQNKTVLVAFVSTTCPACNQARPVLKSIYEKNKTKLGAVFVYAEAQKDVLKYEDTFPAFLDPSRKFSQKLQVNSIPALYVIKDGRVNYQMIGWSADVSKELQLVINGGSQ